MSDKKDKKTSYVVGLENIKSTNLTSNQANLVTFDEIEINPDNLLPNPQDVNAYPTDNSTDLFTMNNYKE